MAVPKSDPENPAKGGPQGTAVAPKGDRPGLWTRFLGWLRHLEVVGKVLTILGKHLSGLVEDLAKL